MKYWNFIGVECCAVCFDVLVGDDVQVLCVELQYWVGVVVGGQLSFVGREVVVCGVVFDVGVFDEKWCLIGVEMVGLYCVGLEVVIKVFGGEDVILVLQCDVVFCKNLVGGLVELVAVGDNVGVFGLFLKCDVELVVEDD